MELHLVPHRLPQSMTLDLGILLSLACAFVANLGFFYKYRGANEVGAVNVRHPLRSAKVLFSSKWFAVGMLVAVASWTCTWGRWRWPRCRWSRCRSRAASC